MPRRSVPSANDQKLKSIQSLLKSLSVSTLSATETSALLQNIQDLATADSSTRLTSLALPTDEDAQAALRHTEERLAAAVHAGNVGLWEWNCSEGGAWWSPQMYALLGVSPHEHLEDETLFSTAHADDRGAVEIAWNRAIEYHADFDARFRIMHPQRGLRWISAQGQITTDSIGTPRVVGTATDITRIVLADTALRESEERYRTLAENMPHMVWETDAQGMNNYQNRVWYDYVGGGVGSSFATDWLTFYHPDDRDHLVLEWDESLRTEGAHRYDLEARIRRHDGAYRWFRVQGAPVHDIEGKVARWVGTCTDIDDQKCGEQALRESEARFRMLADNIAQFAWIAEPCGEVNWYNQRWFDYTGTTLDDMSGTGWRKVYHPDHVARVSDKFRACIDSGEIWEDTFPLRAQDGSYRWFLSRAVPIRDEHGLILRWFGTNTDITEIDARQRKLDAVMEHARVGLAFVAAPSGCFEVISRFGETLFGRTSADMQTRSALERSADLLHPDDLRPALPHELPSERALSGAHLQEEEWVVRRPDGSTVTVLVSGGPLRDRERQLRGAVISWTDISERKAAESAIAALNAELTRNLHNLETLIRVSPVGIAVSYDPECRHITVNPAAAQLLHIKEDLDLSLSTACAENIGCRFMRQGRELTGDELPLQYAARHDVAVRDFEMDAVRDDGLVINLISYASPLHDKEGVVRGCVAIMVNITERRRLEQELIKQQKLESLGVLAGGIAHDFNNILTALFGNIALARLYLVEDYDRARVAEALTEAEGAFRRARDLAQQLLTFARGGAPIRRVADMRQVLRDAVEFALHGSAVQATFAFAPDLWSANIDEAQFGQAVNNIVINAEDAMPHGGRLHVEVRNVRLSDTAIVPLPPGPYVHIEIQDDGVGISEEHISQIFDPYFSTKPNGVGLGLATTYSIIKRHDGHIAVTSRAGHGTTFSIHMPAIEPLPAAQSIATPEGRVLLMDDETAVRDVGRALLTGMGYAVTVASNGEEAVSAFRAASDARRPFDLVILDLTVPDGLAGEACLALLRQIDPNVRALASSGYFNNPVMARYADFGFAGVVPKPYRIEELRDAVERALTDITPPVD